MKRNCHECGTPLMGREDKKFCNDGCRNTFNNRMNRDCNNLMRTVHNALRRNYRILRELHDEGIPSMALEKLAQRGFDFNYLTQIVMTKSGETYRYVYDQGYVLTENYRLQLLPPEE
ncbi:hypothetical protein SAMN05444377_101187 [Flavobacterium fontis]|jgi:predicted nucleic acid-binding Zn ribbon protein|uniref:DUF2116 family Zn-ribbon domain-containing protein n=1 Tax=Flavobacterium fontis TaxID=1124188 RepID=A0A1M4W6A9_9FLAO|nr:MULTISPECIES: hypothetical protein [Flavobacterium]MCZ8169200.1 hypothetical protein [Flavobacterium sp.]MCZ8297665.1 hypothetical protein [Flavobacterium sp.]SHE76737.1 hypothetical protein SAMN05444377_101187 [Flavobacterium fontis]